jgi:cytochrome c nitrite reductase small subunit
MKQRILKFVKRILLHDAAIYFIGAFSFLILFSAIAILFTSRPNFCAICHEQDAQVKSWENSIHRKVNCISCHIEPGLIPLLKDKIFAVKSVYFHFFGGYETPINNESKLSLHMTKESCMRCHMATGKRVYKNSFIMDHKKHVDVAELECPVCHNRVAHEIEGYEDRLSMEYCLTCHDGKTLRNDCEFCHTSGFLEKNKEKK